MAKRLDEEDLKQFKKTLSKKSGVDLSVSQEELKIIADEPPEKPDFPTALFIIFLIIECLDVVVGVGADFTLVGGIIYDVLRIIGIVYLYYWAWKRTHSAIKLTGARRNFIRTVRRYVLVPLLASIPIPIVGAVAQVFPTDIWFILIVHNGHVKWVDDMRFALESINIKINTVSKVIRKARGSNSRENEDIENPIFEIVQESKSGQSKKPKKKDVEKDLDLRKAA